jgi:nucleoside-diphosphate-sugar epimerase
MKNILITGVTGYVGSNLVKALKGKYNIFGVVRKTSDVSGVKDYCHLVFVEDLEDCFRQNKIDLVLHLATNYQKSSKPDDYINLLNDNIIYGLEILKLMQLYDNCKNFININTYFQYNEVGSYLPINFYSATKQAFEDILFYFSKNEGFNIINLVLYDVYGSLDNRRKIFNILKEAVENGDKEFNMTKGEQIMNFLHITDCIEALKISINLTLENKIINDTFYLAGADVSLKEAVKIFISLMKSDIKINFGAIEYLNNILMKSFIGKSLPGFKPSINVKEGLKYLL